MLENSVDENLDFSSLINKFLYLKYYHTIHERNLPTIKYLILDPFKYSTYSKEENNIKFNWITMDLLMNLVIDFKFILQIKLNTDNIDKSLICDYINAFLNGSIARYGFESIKNSHFLINYKDSIMFDNTEPIEKLLTDKIEDANVSYYIEP